MNGLFLSFSHIYVVMFPCFSVTDFYDFLTFRRFYFCSFDGNGGGSF